MNRYLMCTSKSCRRNGGSGHRNWLILSYDSSMCKGCTRLHCCFTDNYQINYKQYDAKYGIASNCLPYWAWKTAYDSALRISKTLRDDELSNETLYKPIWYKQALFCFFFNSQSLLTIYHCFFLWFLTTLHAYFQLWFHFSSLPGGLCMYAHAWDCGRHTSSLGVLCKPFSILCFGGCLTEPGPHDFG